jgi:uncharacterized Zn finger protein (UPF0148 family)
MNQQDSITDRSVDEDTGTEITAGACPQCGGAILVDGGEISCTGCGVILNEYARTGRRSSLWDLQTVGEQA